MELGEQDQRIAALTAELDALRSEHADCSNLSNAEKTGQAMFADIGGLFDMERPIAAGPPGDRTRFQIISG